MSKVAIVTGGTSGMGEATAKELAKRGWQVAAMAREQGRPKAFQGDVAKDADCRRVAKAVLDKWGRIDALVNNAGTTKFVDARRPRGPVRRGHPAASSASTWSGRSR